jgi:hypothetical protein
MAGDQTAHLVAYVRHQAKASAYRRIGHDSRSTWHSKRALAHRQHFGDNREADTAELHVYGPPVWPEPKKKAGLTMTDVKNAAIQSVQIVGGTLAAHSLATGAPLPLPHLAVAIAGTCLICKNALGEYIKGCKCPA